MSRKRKILIAVGAVLFVIIMSVIFVFYSKKEVTYIVTFDSVGGSEVKDQIIKKGELAKRPADPKKDGYLFVEWQLEDVMFNFGTKITKDITLKAYWVKALEDVEMVVIKFDTMGGSTISNQVVQKDSKITKPNEPTKDGYIFKGWFVGDKEFDFDSKITSDVVIIAKWEKVEKKSTSGGNSSVSSSSSSTSKPSSTTKPSEDGSSSITEKKYTVSFNSNGGSSVASQSVKEGSKATKPSNPTKNGYTFDGWKLNGKDYDFNSKVTKNITLFASWKENPKIYYTVSFDSNGGTSMSSQSVLAGSAASNPGNPTREGHTFNGWFLNGNAYNFGSSVSGNITLVASWTQKNYIIKATRVDNISLDYVLTVYENGNPIGVSLISYSDGTYLCSGNNTTVNHDDVVGETIFIVTLSGGTKVTATMG